MAEAGTARIPVAMGDVVEMLSLATPAVAREVMEDTVPTTPSQASVVMADMEAMVLAPALVAMGARVEMQPGAPEVAATVAMAEPAAMAVRRERAGLQPPPRTAAMAGA